MYSRGTRTGQYVVQNSVPCTKRALSKQQRVFNTQKRSRALKYFLYNLVWARGQFKRVGSICWHFEVENKANDFTTKSNLKYTWPARFISKGVTLTYVIKDYFRILFSKPSTVITYRLIIVVNKNEPYGFIVVKIYI